jgi:hypothetical protein
VGGRRDDDGVKRISVRLTVAVTLVWVVACTPAQLDQVQDASDKRDVICRFVETWTPNQPELAEIRTLCRAGADLQEIAAAYAGCREAKP